MVNKRIVIIFISNDYKNEIYNADAMVSNRKDIILGILTADCAPIVVLSKKNFGIIHAGWKGLISGIIENTFNEFVKRGEALENLKVFVGPHLKTKSDESWAERKVKEGTFSIELTSNGEKFHLMLPCIYSPSTGFHLYHICFIEDFKPKQ